ncbi:formylmethanofuran dehydrogenase subunit C [Phyllobacterium endophyticum]|uniref:Formylmethanofuran dehydrogenase subunit C n=1 Tax=Phyllobacterium endophyticum TaxID=1149773 RepID=A0A2P7AM69_9HYPH|nr:formylmethanofuran dehydrogenase subunit C [Phyllobacterium endophyticum]MBB3238491.1 formylmethanofuran dehydrogenase subunit C [Phyllobacterium endophyticum]PSH55310.1 formylmethanofuran dehydrogenase subunit C [Phyllobacterium endophyticum]TXR46753.1 formylmethanofuran dehydrogenase subunit C [Phyllobacterium endophyticum]TYR43156.1 formylmethanofuran dehydrogenase subunit C [Phyllobacterium endophyticum]
MKALTFSLLAEPEERLDLSALTPAGLAGLTDLDIARLRIGSGRQPATVGDVFKVTGRNVENIVIEGGSTRIDKVGTGLALGAIRVTGAVGSQAGRQMTGGSLLIEGSAGHHAGSGMSGGRLEIKGNAGDCLGGPLAGEITGMEGGMLIVRGKAGNYAGERLRRGIIAILRGCGDYAGYRMIAGTIAVTGRVGATPGYLMKRGSLLFDRRPEFLAPTFIDCGETDIAFSGLFDRFLIREKIIDRPLLGASPGKFGGDLAVSGKGEILFRRGR